MPSPSTRSSGLSGLLIALAVAMATLLALPAQAISVGEPVATGDDGAAVAFGNEDDGRTVVPVLPAAITYSAVAAGARHTVLLRSDGVVAASGANTLGQAPGEIAPPAGAGWTYTAVAAGGFHTVLLRSDGTVETLGLNNDGQAPGEIAPPAGAGWTYTAVAAGGAHTVLLRSDGTVETLGLDDDGQAPGEIAPPAGAGWTYTAVAAGGFHTVLLRSDGTVETLGLTIDGQAPGEIAPPAASGWTYTAVAAGAWHTALLRSDGAVETLGNNLYGQAPGVLTPPSGTEYTAVAAGAIHTVLLRSDGAVQTVGTNSEGQAPGIIVPPTGADGAYTAVAAGEEHTVILRAAVDTSIEVDTPSTSMAGQEIALSAQISVDPEPGLDYTGSVVFTIDSVDQAPVPVDADGSASITHTFTPTGDHTVTAAYSGSTDGTYRASGPPPVETVAVVASAPTSITLDPATAGVTAGDTIGYTVTGTDAYGNAVGALSPAEVVIDVPGESVTDHDVTLTTAGDHTVTATLVADATVTATAYASVTPGPVASLTVAIEGGPAQAGLPVVVTVTGWDQFGNEVGQLDAADLVIDTPTGAAGPDGSTFSGVGTHTITVSLASDPSISATTDVEVAPGPVARVTIEAAAPEVAQGRSLTFVVTAHDEFGNIITLGPDDAVLTSDHATDVIDGLTVTFAHASPHVITATVDGISDSVTVEVIPAPMADTGASSAWLALVAAASVLVGVAALSTRRRHPVI